MSKARVIGEDVWKNKTDKISLEVFTLMYGSIVTQLCEDFENDYQKVNKQLEKMGYNIGLRLIDEFLAKTAVSRCQELRDTAEVISRIGFKMFLNVTPQITNWSDDNKQFSIVMGENGNPLAEFVELSSEKARKELWYSNVLVGVIRGALEMVQISVEAEFVSDQLHGASSTEIRVKFIEFLRDQIPPGE